MTSIDIKTPSIVHCGTGTLGKLAQSLAGHKARSILIVTDRVIAKQRFFADLTSSLTSTGISWKVVDNVASEPSIDDVQQALEQAYACASNPVQAIVAIGGGSVMDTAKLIGVLWNASYQLADLLDNSTLAVKQLPTFMVPTTCGTGSEATGNAIVALPALKTKKGIVNRQLIPDEVYLDPVTVSELPRHIVAATAVDALAHCVECTTGNKATVLSDLYATAGAKLIFHNIVPAYRDQDVTARANLLLGAYYGGVAITGSGTTAVHALSYPLGGRYHIPHGVSNAILFASVMAVNKPACVAQLAALCDVVYPQHYAMGADRKADIIVDSIATIVKEVDIPTNLRNFGLQDSDLEDLVEAAGQQQRLLVNNPRVLTATDIRSIYVTVMGTKGVGNA